MPYGGDTRGYIVSRHGLTLSHGQILVLSIRRVLRNPAHALR
jgi:hypothetical protein